MNRKLSCAVLSAELVICTEYIAGDTANLIPRNNLVSSALSYWWIFSQMVDARDGETFEFAGVGPVLKALAIGSVLGMGICAPPVHAIESGYVTRVIDGDTLEVKIGDENIRVRLADVDAPELVHPRCELERDLARRARDLVLSVTRERAVGIERMGRDKYRRVVAIVRVPDGRASVSLGDILIREGLGVRWNGGRGTHPNPWCHATR